jgi:hypothetical protein
MKHYHLILTGLFACVFCHVQGQEHRLLRDLYAYETAVEMYAVADTLPVDKTVTLLAVNISRQLEQGRMPEDDIIWDTLQKLEPYRKSRQVQETLKTWVKHIRKAEGFDFTLPRSSRYTDNNSLIFPVSQAYRQGEFDKVIALSRDLLHNPGVKSQAEVVQIVRNNLALALMHENRDLCAQMELELLNTETEIRYFPALINLTVVYERLGKREEAEVLVNRLAEYMEEEKPEMPLMDFNAAWYLGEKEDYPSVDNALKSVSSKLMKKQKVTKYADYRKPLAARYKTFSILKIGFLGKVFTGSDGWWIVGILIFIVYWIAAVALWMGTGLFNCINKVFEKVFGEDDFLFIAFLLLLYFASVFVLAWGIPSSAVEWIGLAVLGVCSWLFVFVKGTE